MPSIRWNEHSDYLTDSVSELYRNSDFTDCVLDVDGGSIEVHKTILAACSPYFKKLLKNDNAITTIPIKDVKYKDLKLILDFIYYGEIDVHIQDVSSLIKTAELMEIASLKLSVSHCFGKDFSCNDTSIRSLNDGCSVSCTNLIRNETKNLLGKPVSHDSTVLYMREERFNSECQNIHLQSMSDSTTKYLNDFHDVPEKLNKDQPKGSISNICDSFKEITKPDEENVNDELIPLTFVAVTPVLEINEPMEGHQDNRLCFDSVLKDPLGEYSGILDVTKEGNIKEDCTFQSELQVKNEPKEENDVPESMTEVVLIADKLTHSCHELTSAESNPFVSCDQESVVESNPGVVFSNTLCSEGCAAEEMHDMEIKFEPICEISEADVKEEKIFETGQCLNHSVGDDTGTPPLEPERELLKSGAQHFLTIDYQQDLNKGEYDASTSKVGSPFHLEIGNETPAMHSSAFAQTKPCEERRESMVRSGSNLSHIASLNAKTQCNDQQLVPRDLFLLDHSKITCGHSLTEKVQTHCSKRKNYSCIRCSMSFSQKVQLERHWGIHVGEKPFQCEICKSSFSQSSYLKTHMFTHSGEKQFKCEICEKSFNKTSNLKRHMLTHSGVKPFQCEICEKSFSQKSKLQNHIRIHTGEKPFQCEVCKLSISQRCYLKTHMLTHSGEKPFMCEICEKSFTTSSIHKTHMLKHSGVKPFKCEICEKSFYTTKHLKRHMQIHSGVKPFQCKICEKSFSLKRSFKIHIGTHTGEKPFHCEICKSSFSQRGNLKTHMLTHSGEKPHLCDICEKSFTSSSSLKTHMLTHSGVKPFLCEICEKSFTTSSNLKMHMSTHFGEKPFVCEICQKSFRIKSTLIQHIQTHA